MRPYLLIQQLIAKDLSAETAIRGCARLITSLWKPNCTEFRHLVAIGRSHEPEI